VAHLNLWQATKKGEAIDATRPLSSAIVLVENWLFLGTLKRVRIKRESLTPSKQPFWGCRKNLENPKPIPQLRPKSAPNHP
jgi:hypothetical protein